ncbi:hypothetical protein GGF50DRAFT_117842 [Schizophyllum commune]
MPTPAVYVIAILGTVAAGLAFKEFVYEPHIAPKVERWAEDFLERRRRARSRTLARPYEAAYFDAESLDDKKSDGVAPDSFDDKRSFELENMVTKEVHEWRKEVERSTLRRRKPQLHTSVDDIPFEPMTPTPIRAVPTHVICDPSSPTFRTSSPSSQGLPTPAASVRELPSPATLLQPLPAEQLVPEPQIATSAPQSQAGDVQSLSMSHPLAASIDLDIMSASSLSRAPSVASSEVRSLASTRAPSRAETLTSSRAPSPTSSFASFPAGSPVVPARDPFASAQDLLAASAAVSTSNYASAPGTIFSASDDEDDLFAGPRAASRNTSSDLSRIQSPTPSNMSSWADELETGSEVSFSASSWVSTGDHDQAR